MTTTDMFEASLEFPDPDATRKLSRLVGIDEQRDRLQKGLILAIDRHAIVRWSEEQHGGRIALADLFLARPPLFLLAGDVGTGKTALAESIGDAVARQLGLPITLHRLSLASRGAGLVGEMTQLVTQAFAAVSEMAAKAKGANGKVRGGHIMLIDEADALAQSRETAQMHHEDRAGVNALIRGINSLAEAQMPAAVIMCTNRAGAIDPAVLRRASELLVFGRPGDEQRRMILENGLAGLDFDAGSVDQLVRLTGASRTAPGFTYSDMTQRLLPTFALDAFPDRKVTQERAVEIARGIAATPVFAEEGR